MRVVAEIPHPEFKISIFAWNGKFILKIEAGIYEQAFRINEETVGGDLERVKSMVTEEFLKDFRSRFLTMREDLNNALKKSKYTHIMKFTRTISGKILTVSLLSILLLATSCGGGKADAKEGEEEAKEKPLEKSKVDVPAGAIKIGYIRSDSINEKYLFLIDRKKELENESIKAEGTLKAEYNRMMKKQQELEGKFKFMTISEQQAAQEEMMKMGEKYRLMEEKIGMELQEKNGFFQKQLYENVEAYLAKYAEANGFDFIFRYEMGLNLMYGSEKYNITSDVLNGLNDEYKSAMK